MPRCTDLNARMSGCLGGWSAQGKLRPNPLPVVGEEILASQATAGFALKSRAQPFASSSEAICDVSKMARRAVAPMREIRSFGRGHVGEEGLELVHGVGRYTERCA